MFCCVVRRLRTAGSRRLTEGGEAPKQRPVVLRGGQHKRRHQLADELRLDLYALVAHHNVHHLCQVGAVHLQGQCKLLKSQIDGTLHMIAVTEYEGLELLSEPEAMPAVPL